jgi:G3E family GTPase
MTPVHILTGFLGSGKTTLLSRLLRDRALARTAVIINEFGEIGLDHELVETSDEQIVQLTTGCLCCAVQTDLARTLLALQARRCAGEIAFDRVIVETSGLSDPAPVLQTLMTDRAVGAHYRLGRVVTTVDGVTGENTLSRATESRKQIAFADRMILTKTDLAEPSNRLLSALAELNQSAPVTRNTGSLDADVLFGFPDETDLVTSAERTHRHAAQRHRDTGHIGGISTVSLIHAPPVPASAVPLFLSGLTAHLGAKLLRLKGIVQVAEAPETPMVIQAVQHVLHEPRWLAAWPSGERRTRIVLIGEDLPRRWPQLLFDAVIEEVVSVARSPLRSS